MYSPVSAKSVSDESEDILVEREKKIVSGNSNAPCAHQYAGSEGLYKCVTGYIQDSIVSVVVLWGDGRQAPWLDRERVKDTRNRLERSPKGECGDLERQREAGP